MIAALAFSNVTGLPLWFSVAITGLICTKYTVVGGMRGVIWSDTYQIVIVIVSLLVLACVGGEAAGGPTAVWKNIMEGGRVNFNLITPDPLERHTLWSQCFGSVFTWLPLFTTNQMIVQRFQAASSTREAQRAGYMALLIAELTMMLVVITGLVMYAVYLNCDPMMSGRIQQPDQMVPLFVMDMVGHMPGLPGLFTAAVFAASLSSLSSAINSMAAVCLEDFIKPAMRAKNKTVKENAATILAKVMAFVFGLTTIGLSYVAPYLGTTLIQIPITVWGMVGGPLFGIFLLGIFFPCGNTAGALSGLLGSLCLCLWLGVGGILYGTPGQTLPLTANNCSFNLSTLVSVETAVNTTLLISNDDAGLDSSLQNVYNISYVWRGLIGTVVCLLIGLVVSILTGGSKKGGNCNDRDLMNPIGSTCCYCCPSSCISCLDCGYKEQPTTKSYDEYKDSITIEDQQKEGTDNKAFT